MAIRDGKKYLAEEVRERGKAEPHLPVPLATEEASLADGVACVEFLTEEGMALGILHAAPNPSPSGVIWLGGEFGGFNGPAQALYTDLARPLMGKGISSLQLHYRLPNFLPASIGDVLMAIDFLCTRKNCQGIALVGHSFGGAVAIGAAVRSTRVKAVVALSSQLHGTQGVGKISPRPLLLVHGKKDPILPAFCSQEIYERAKQPKQLLLYPEAGHFFWECRHELRTLLGSWLTEKLIR